MDWENLKFFLAVAREGTLAGAGRALSVKHSTVFRRIAQLEDDLGLKLFDRHPNGYLLTAVGREMLAPLAQVDEDLVALERRLSGQDLRLTGTVRISTVGVLVPWLSQVLVEFRTLYPGIIVEVLISPAMASLARHYSLGRSDLPHAQWTAAHIPPERFVLRTNHTGMLVAAVKAGLGLGLLPCYLGDAEPGLRRLKTLEGLGQDMWILTHSDLKRTPRIRALMDFLAKELARRRDLIEGRMAGEADD